MNKMIVYYAVMGMLLYSTTIRGHPAVKEEKDNSKIKTEEYITGQTEGLPDLVDDSYSHIAVDTLISKVTELSKQYRNDVNGTISDIQHMIQTDGTLPRLTRGEIIELLENLTNTSPEAWRNNLEKSRKDYQRAIMLVMPYTPKATDTISIEELFTKPPITHIIGGQPATVVTKKHQDIKKNIEILALDPSTQKPSVVRRPVNPVKQLKSDQDQDTKTLYHREQKPYKEVSIKQMVTNKYIPESSTRISQVSTQTPEITTYSTRPRISTFKQKSKPTRYSNHKYPEASDNETSNQGITIIEAPSLAPRPFEIAKNQTWVIKNQVKPVADQQTENENNKKQANPMHFSVHKKINNTIKPRYTTTISPSTMSTSTQTPLFDYDFQENMRDIIKGVNFKKNEVKVNLPKYSSQYGASSLSFTKQDTSTENVRDVLGSIAASQQVSTAVPGISEIADTLTPDMKSLLMSFGLIEDSSRPNTEINEPFISQPNSEVLHISPQSYTQFKPLPESTASGKDMLEFLAEFGLTENSQRSSKKLETQKIVEKPHLFEVPNINMEMIPESMHDVLEDIGISQKKERKISIKDDGKTHIFNPERTSVSETEIKRLNQLFETIKRLEKLNRTATPEDLKDLDLENIRELTKILKQDTSVPLNEQHFGPNPLDFDLSPQKNEVKRQENSTTSTDASKNVTLAALEESFGGNAGAAAENVDESLPPPRRSGFYYLVDWNSFLEVGEEGKNKVNIRFSPQAGDPSRFLRVNVP